MAYYRKRGNKWSFTVDVGIDPKTGKRKQKTMSGFADQKEAEKACAALITDIERGSISIENKRTLGDFMNHFLTHILIHDVEEATLDGKWSIFRNHIEPQLGRKVLQKLKPDDLQVFYNRLIQKGMSPGGIANVYRLINQTLNLAMEWGYITRNVNKLVRKPEYKQKKVEVWSKEQFDQFLTSTMESYLHPFYMIALNTGMRPGEICALKWDKVDVVKMQILVDSTATRTKKDGYHVKPSPKNDSSVRTITIPPNLVQYLKRYKLSQPPNDLNLVIPGIESPILWLNTVHTIMKDDIKSAGMPPLGPHGLRHTHATYLLSPQPYGLGISVKAVSERLGHSKTTTTINTYFGVLPNMQDGIAEQLERYAQKSVDN